MNIIYLFTTPSIKGSSVQTKVLNQIKYLNKAGADCKGAFFSKEVSKITPLDEFSDLIPVARCKWKYFRVSGQKIKTMQAVLTFAKQNHKNTDFFYFRYPGAGNLLKNFTTRFGNKTIFEHLSIEEFELKLHANENPISLKPSQLLSWLEYSALPLCREYIYGKSLRRKAKLGICNSQEIADFQNKKSGGVYKCMIGGDAVEVDTFPLSPRPEFNHELRLVFLKGASTSADFNGLDRMIWSIANYKGEIEIKLFVLGHQLQEEQKMVEAFGIKKNVILFPSKNGEDLNNFLKDIHIGVATLSLYRKGLNQTTTIKVREYTAQGLPFIYAYTDPDLNEDAKEFALKFPNDDSLIDMNKVIEFAKNTIQNKELPQKMRKYAEEHLDYGVKMKKLLKELQKLKYE